MAPNPQTTILIPAVQMKAEFQRILLSLGFTAKKAEQCAEIFTLNSLEGIYSHGVNRFPRFVKNTKDGYVKPDAEPALVHRAGALEQWNGNLGPGPLNASFAVERAMEIADTNTLGMVAMANTNHWMRGGTYGWKAAKNGYVYIGWTNTEANMPAWGAVDKRLGNNPFVIAVPYKEEAIVLDMAMTQFSYGKIEMYKQEDKELPFPGGFNKSGELTKKPGEILETWRALPIGYWKGAGFSLLLDILATILTAGIATHQISKSEVEFGVSQIFIAIQLTKLSNFPAIENAIDQIIQDYLASTPENETSTIRFPGEHIVKTRTKNLRDGIPVNKEVWDGILSL